MLRHYVTSVRLLNGQNQRASQAFEGPHGSGESRSSSITVCVGWQWCWSRRALFLLLWCGWRQWGYFCNHQKVLKWKNGAKHRKFRNVYYGDSDTSRWRPLQYQKHRENVASHCRKITDFFVKSPAQVVDGSNAESSTSNSEDELSTRMSLEEAIEKIGNSSKENQWNSSSGYRNSFWIFVQLGIMVERLSSMNRKTQRHVWRS